MAGSYLKSLQLTKQLEERTKEASKNRELAEKEEEALEELLKRCEAADVDTSDVDKSRQDFEAAIAMKDYQAALGHIRKSAEVAKNAYIHKVGDVADSAEALVALMEGSEETTDTVKDLLERSKDRMMSDDLDGAMKLARNAYDAAERGLHEFFSGLFSQAQEVIIQAKEMGNDVAIFENQLTRAKSALENQEYEACASEIREVLEAAGEDIKTQISGAISRAEELVSAGEEFGSDMSRVKNHVDRAKSNLESFRYKDALAYAKRAEGEGENAISTKLQERVRETRESIKRSKATNTDVTVPQELLEQAQNALKEKKYIEAVHALSTAHDRTHQIQFQSVLEVISAARDRFVLAKKVGVDMSKSIALLNTARDHLKLGKFQEAMDYAQQSKKEVDSALEKFYKARDDLVELAKAAKFAADLGADATSVKNLLTGARKSFEAKEYEATIEAAKQGIADSKKLAYGSTMASIDTADKAVKLGKEIGADVTEAAAVLQKSLDSLSREDMPESLSMSKESLEVSKAAMTRIMSDRLQSLDMFVKSHSGDAIMSEAEATISEARQSLASFDFEKTSALVRTVTQKLESVGQVECEKLLGVAESKIEDVRKLGGDAADLGVLLTRARSAFDQKVYEDSTTRAREIVQLADEAITRLVHAEFSSVKDSLEEAKTIGIDIEEAKTNLRGAKAKVEAQDLVEAFMVARATKTDILSKIARYDGIKGKIRRTEELISDAGRAKVDVAALTRMLDSARTLFADARLQEAEEALDKCLLETEKRLAMYLAAKFILSAKDRIDLAKSTGIDMRQPTELLARAKDQMKSKTYEDALASAKQCDELSKSIVSSSISTMITELQRLLADARNVGVETAGPEKLAEKALSLARAGDFVESLRCIASAKQDIDHIKNLSSQAALEIRVARNHLKDAETLDINVGRARDFLDQAIDALTRHQYAIALELAKKSSDISAEIIKARIWDNLEMFKEKVEKAGAEGSPVGMADRCVSEGIKAFREGRYQEALKLTLTCETEMERAELQRDISTRAVELAKKKLAEASVEGIKSDRLNGLVKKAGMLVQAGKFVEALTVAIESGDELHAIKETMDACRIEIGSARERLERLKRIGIDTSECDDIINLAQEQMAGQDFHNSRETLKRASDMAEDLFESSVKDVMEQNRLMISKANSMGINTKPCDNLMEVANTSFKEKLWDFAYQQAMACKKSCLELMGRKMSRLIDEIDRKVDDLKRYGASAGAVEELLENAKQAEAAGEVSDAFQILMQADSKMSTIEDAHKKYLDISIAAESAMEGLARFGLSRREPERLIAMSEIEKDKDYDSAIELVAEALDTAKTMMESYSPEVSGSISAVGLQEGVSGDMVIIVKNNGKALAKDVSAALSGEFNVQSSPTLASLKPGAEEKLTLKVVPKHSGDLRVNVKVSAKRQFDGRIQTHEIQDSVNVFPSGPAYKMGRATEQTRCIACQGRIKPGFDILSCRCGGQLHLSCAKRIGQCPICTQKYSV